ncbi:hypothetical protein PQR01_16405, partial [Paraburkholderia rhynchosiae]
EPSTPRLLRHPVPALCQSAEAAHIDAQKPGAGSNSGRAHKRLVCGRRAFYGLMTCDETGVLRPQAA